jgi:hypothetical protein
MRREIPMAITIISGVAMIIFFFVPVLENWSDILLKWFSVIAGFALVLGAFSLLLVNLGKISRKASGWHYNVVLLLGLIIMASLGIFGGIKVGTPYNFMFSYIYTPLSATMFSLLAFYIASAAFRAFKAKTFEAGLLLATAFIVMMGRVPLGEIIWSSIPMLNQIPLGDEIIEKWVMGCFNTAGQRAIIVGASIGIISVSMKILLGVERAYLGGGD